MQAGLFSAHIVVLVCLGVLGLGRGCVYWGSVCVVALASRCTMCPLGCWGWCEAGPGGATIIDIADFWASQLAREKNASPCGAKHIDVKIGDQFSDTHGWLKKDQVNKNARFTTVATTFLEPKNPCWSIVGVTIGAVSNPPGSLWMFLVFYG